MAGMPEREGALGPTSAPGDELPAAEPREAWGSLARMATFTALSGLLLAAASILPYAGVGIVVLAPLLRRAGAMVGRARALVPPLALVLSSPILLLMPLLMMTDPVVESLWRCGTAEMGGLVALPLMALVAGLVAAAGALVLGAFMPRLLVACAPWLRAAVLLVSSGLLVVGLVRLARFPQPEDWTSSLRVAARADGLETARLGTCRDGCDLPPIAFEAGGKARTLLLACKTDRCTMRLGDAEGRTLESVAGQEGAASPGAPVEVRAHDRLGLAVVVQQGRTMVAFDVIRGEAVDVPLRDVAGEVAPSSFALLAMAFAIAVAIQRARCGFGERAAVKRLHEGIDARIDDDGVVHPVDGSDAFRPPGPLLPEGPGVVLARPVAGTYRSGADRGTWVLPGTRAFHVDAHRHRAAVFDWEAVAALCAAGAPLFAAALRGLLL